MDIEQIPSVLNDVPSLGVEATKRKLLELTWAHTTLTQKEITSSIPAIYNIPQNLLLECLDLLVLDGKLTKNEQYKNPFYRVLGVTPPETMVKMVSEMVDVAGDMGIDQQQLKAQVKLVYPSVGQQKMKSLTTHMQRLGLIKKEEITEYDENLDLKQRKTFFNINVFVVQDAKYRKAPWWNPLKSYEFDDSMFQAFGNLFEAVLRCYKNELLSARVVLDFALEELDSSGIYKYRDFMVTDMIYIDKIDVNETQFVLDWLVYKNRVLLGEKMPIKRYYISGSDVDEEAPDEGGSSASETEEEDDTPENKTDKKSSKYGKKPRKEDYGSSSSSDSDGSSSASEMDITNPPLGASLSKLATTLAAEDETFERAGKPRLDLTASLSPAGEEDGLRKLLNSDEAKPSPKSDSTCQKAELDQ